MVVSLPIFLQNLDTSIIGPALPTMAKALGVDTLQLNLAITSYLISLAIFLPVSGWLADRFGARRVFCWAILTFSISSALCAVANSLETLVICRILQGLGGAMMVPVGRLILLRSVVPSAMVAAMVWFTVPPVLGRMLGPLIGGATVTWFSWRWIFLMNIPVGVIAVVLALMLVDALEPDVEAKSFDLLGFVLLGGGTATTLAAVEGFSGKLLAVHTSAALGGIGALCIVAYVFHSLRAKAPLIDLRILSHPTYFASVVGGIPARLAIGAMPLLLNLLFQLGFGLSPLDSGLLTMATALGALATRGILARALKLWGFRAQLLGASAGTSLCYLAYGYFHVDTPHAILMATMFCCGLLMSMVMVSLQTLAFTEIPKQLMGDATGLSAVMQQLFISFGVMLAVELLRVAVKGRGAAGSELIAGDFPFVFFSFSAILLPALIAFWRLPRDVGAELCMEDDSRAATKI